MPKISVIVPAFNVQHFIERCIKSIINQTYTDFELVLIDDGSTDKTADICDKWSTDDSRIKVYHKQNGGISDARNFGINMSTGDYITFIDSDDYVKETYLDYLFKLFNYSDKCSVTACNHYVVTKDKTSINFDFTGNKTLTKHEALEEVLYHGMIDVSLWGKLYKKEVFNNIKFPYGKLYEDTYVFGDVLNSTDEIVYGGEPQYFYVQRANSIVNSVFHEKRTEFIDAVDNMLSKFETVYPDLSDGFVRRRVHSKLSVLRYMEKCEGEYKDLRNTLKKDILRNKKNVLKNPKAPKRDKLAIILLQFGYFAFYKAWNLYTKNKLSEG